jgi:hypothetical protein
MKKSSVDIMFWLRIEPITYLVMQVTIVTTRADLFLYLP